MNKVAAISDVHLLPETVNHSIFALLSVLRPRVVDLVNDDSELVRIAAQRPEAEELNVNLMYAPL
ncbi:hypothetical protein KC878_02330 [Candidatus Saccharibacteria bacterium]|nr:hypothetical protein [Candidatus Saccharibacteria bacterium]MCB9821080.1 hypothetical protein [Candidatus Nomurabacteria bacterium]